MMGLAGSSKSRKPYKITKPRERWSEEEHEKFLEAIDRFGRNWKDIVSFVGTRSVSQVRSHAQKHFIRLEKKGLGSVVPPARRKARWGDKQAPDSLDGSIDSDQELSAANRQTGSSSSMSTVDFYHTSTTAGSSAHCTEGSGSNAEYHDCQPITSHQESFASFPSQGGSFSSPPSQSIISYAQEFLRRCNSSGVNTPAVAELASCTLPQPMPATARGTNVHMLQEVASMQQNAGFSLHRLAGNAQSSTSVALQQQQQLQQLLCQQQPKSRFSAAGINKHSSSSSAQRPAFGSWPWQRASTPDFPAQFSASHRESSSLNMQSDQQSCPQLDGTFLADVIKASSAPPSLSVHSLSQPIIAGRSLSASSTRSPLGSAFHMGLKGNQEPSQSVSPTTSFQTLPSNSSILTVKPDVELCAADTHLDSSFGLDEQDFWADFSLEDPLMQAVDAAMGCGASADSCL
ncbi:TPA: hypothetical protein ACH3X2_009637 [Trebouxia sp. C0005]